MNLLQKRENIALIFSHKVQKVGREPGSTENFSREAQTCVTNKKGIKAPNIEKPKLQEV